jgi:hypothetical protein
MNKLDRKNIEDIIALTPMQEGILFHYLRDKESEQFFEQLSLSISGTIDLRLFKKAWEFVIETNDVLRALFCWENVKKPLQIILKEHKLNLRYYDYTIFKDSEKKNLLKRIKIKDREEKFNLDKEVPFRITLYKIENDKYELIISNHHILYDGWSSGIILKEFFNAYHSLYYNNCLNRPKKNKFKEYVKWIHNQDKNKLRSFWNDFFKGYNDKTDLLIKNQNINKKKNVEHYQFKFADELTFRLEHFAAEHKISLASILYGAWGGLLQKYNYFEDVIFDTTVSGRPTKVKGVENIVGLFMNTLPFRIKVTGDMSILEFLNNINKMSQKREKYECTPVEILNEFRNKSKNQLFNSLIVIENYPLDKILMKENNLLSISSYSIHETTGYDLTIIITIFEGINIQFAFDKNLFDKESIIRLTGHLITVVKEIINKHGSTISAIDILMDNQVNIGVNFDSKLLPKIESADMDYTSLNEVEKVLLNIWAEVLGKTPGVNDDFFEIGGDSIALVRVYKQINDRFPEEIKVNDFFENPTIKKLGRLISGNKIMGNNNTKKINVINF